MLMGKTFWKSLTLTRILYGTEITYFTFTAEEINKLQIFDNRAYRNILKVPNFTAIEFLRGEIDASSSKARDIKNELLFMKTDCNPTLNRMANKDFKTKINKWAKQISSSLETLNMNPNDLKQFSKDMLEKKKEWDTRKWKEGMTQKDTLSIYRSMKINQMKKNGLRMDTSTLL